MSLILPLKKLPVREFEDELSNIPLASTSSNSENSGEVKSINLPTGFSIVDNRLFYKDVWLCTPFVEVKALTRDENNQNWGRQIQFKDPDGFEHTLTVAMSWLGGDGSALFEALLSRGLTVSTKARAKQLLTEYIQKCPMPKRLICVSRNGWHGDTFVLEHDSIPRQENICYQPDSFNDFSGFGEKETLEEWQGYIALPCTGNSRLTFALACAFAPPLLPLLNVESGGFNLVGSSSIGKSTCLRVAASVWGRPGFAQSWKVTGNALEAVAEHYNHMLLPLDELGQVDGREVGEIAYMLANECGKNRLKSKGGLRRKYSWKLLFLSTGEVSLEDKMNEAGKVSRAGMSLRMIDIPADAGKDLGIFDTLNEFRDGHHLSDELKKRTAEYYGTPIRLFLASINQHKQEIHKTFTQIEVDFCDRFVPQGADGQVKRVAQRFALLATAGEYAISSGILPFESGTVFKDLGVCFEDWLSSRGSVHNLEIENAIRQIKHFFEKHHESRFQTLIGGGEQNADATRIINNLAGYKKRVSFQDPVFGDVRESFEFFVFPETFRNEICKGFNDQTILKELAKRGYLIKGNDRQFVKSKKLPSGMKKIYHFTSKILEDV
jgi:putative DNA primase/helicase